MADCFLGLDLGTSSVKALVVDEGGRGLGRGGADYPILRPHAGQAEQDPKDWWRATVAATRRAVAEAGGVAPAAIGLSGQMHGTVLIGDDDRPIAPAIIWADQRSARQVEEVTERVGRERLIELTGSPLAVGFQAATIRWLQTERPELWRGVRRILLPKDAVRLRLTGAHATDPSDGSGALLLDVRTRDWSPVLLAALDLDPGLLPPVQPSAAVAGGLRPDAATELGLPPDLPVVTGAADTAAGAIGAGIVDPTTLFVSLGTGGQVVLPASAVRVDLRGRVHTFCSAIDPGPDRAGWYHMGATLAAGMALAWLRDRVFDLHGADAFDRMTDWAAKASPGADGLLFLPYLVGERSPHLDPNARGLFLGLTAGHGRPELVRAVMEGITFSLYDAYRVLIDLGAAPNRLILAGGGARSPLWRRIVADVFNLPVQPLTTVEQSALGAARLAAIGTGCLAPNSARGWSAYGPAVEPNADRHVRYESLFALYQSAYAKHRDDFPRLAALGDQPEGG